MRRLLFLPLALLLIAPAAQAQLPLHPPEIRTLFPLGGNRDATVEVRVAGVNVGDATGVAVSGVGITAEVLGPDGQPLSVGAPRSEARIVSDTEARVRFHIAKDAPLGIREFRLYTPVGLSCRGLFGVGPEGAATMEAEPNDSQPQVITVSGSWSVEGTISGGEDADRYRFQAREGDRLACHIEAQGLESELDSLLTLRGPSGNLLASNDDFRGKDSALAFTAPAAGEYVLEVRDSDGQGGAGYAYRLFSSRAPYLRTTYPLGAPAGSLCDVSLFGLNLGDQGKTKDFYSVNFDSTQARVEMPTTPGGTKEFQVATPGGLTNPFSLQVLDVPDTREQEPNDETAQAARVAVPGAAHGRIFGSATSPQGDADCWKFTAKKGQKLTVAVTAMKVGSPLDATLTLYGPDGAKLASSDDANGSRDPALEFDPPADGEYIARIEEAARGGGIDFVYMLRVDPVKAATPGFSLAIYPLNPSVPRGGSIPVEVRVTRTGGFTGPLRYQLPPLPPGVTALIPPEAATEERFYIALSAAADAPYTMGPFSVIGTASLDGKDMTREATGQERVWKNAPLRPVASTLTGIAVCEPMDFTVALDRQELELKPGEEKEVTVIIRKIRAYPRGIPVRAATVDYNSGALPNGLSVGRVTLSAEAQEVKVTVGAEMDTKPGEYTVFVCGLSNPTTNDYILIAQLAPALKVRVKPGK